MDDDARPWEEVASFGMDETDDEAAVDRNTVVVVVVVYWRRVDESRVKVVVGWSPVGVEAAASSSS